MSTTLFPLPASEAWYNATLWWVDCSAACTDGKRKRSSDINEDNLAATFLRHSICVIAKSIGKQ